MAQDQYSEAQGETTDKKEHEKEVEIAKLKQLLAEAKQAEAEAKQAEAEAKLPTSKTTGLKGTITVDKNAGYYAEIIAYKAVEAGAEQIVKNINKVAKKGPLIILKQTDLAEEAALWKILKIKLKASMEALETTISNSNKIAPVDVSAKKKESSKVKALTEEDINATMAPLGVPLAALSAAPVILGAVADIAAFFNTNRTITARAVTIKEQALIAAVANKLHEKNKKLRIILPERNLAGEGELLTGIRALMDKRKELLEIREKLNSQFEKAIRKKANKVEWLEAKKNILNKQIDKTIETNNGDIAKFMTDLEETVKELYNCRVYEQNQDEVIPRIDKEIKAVDELIAAFTEKTNDKLSPLETVALIEKIGTENNQSNELKLLHLMIVSQGGEIETSQHAIWADRVSYIGGAVISYVLTNQNGEYLCSGNVIRRGTTTYNGKAGAISMNPAKIEPELMKSQKVVKRLIMDGQIRGG